jgi:hypothetical protein
MYALEDKWILPDYPIKYYVKFQLPRRSKYTSIIEKLIFGMLQVK